MANATVEGLLATVGCPLCESRAFHVVRHSRYSPEITLEELQAAFRASSDHGLLDQLVRCDSCSLTYINPRVSEAILLRGYCEAVDPDFVAQNPERVKTFTRMIRRILRRLKVPANSGLRILDVGCAGGAFLVAARNSGLQPVGIEPSHWLAEYGRKTYGLEVHQGILKPASFPDASFDLVSLWDVIEHVTEPASLLGTIHRVLKPDG